ncbi:MAG: DUF4177 domain-containing protein [Maioricimonas sp. JB049]
MIPHETPARAFPDDTGGDDRDGLQFECVSVLADMRDLLADWTALLEQLSESTSRLLEQSGATPQVAGTRSKEYKILTQKDKWFSGKFDPAVLEQALNSYAEEGWRVSTTATATIPGFGGSRDEIIVILER